MEGSNFRTYVSKLLLLKNDNELTDKIQTEFKREAAKLRYDVSIIFYVLDEKLELNDFRVRYFIFKMMVIVFQRSHMFRLMFTSKIKHIFLLVTGDGPINVENQFGFSRYFKKLRCLAYENLKYWCQHFGPAYNNLLEYKFYLKKSLNIDLNRFLNNRNEDNDEHLRNQTKKRVLDESRKRMMDSLNDIKLAQNEALHCLRIMGYGDLDQLFNDCKDDKPFILKKNADNKNIIRILLDYSKIIKNSYLEACKTYLRNLINYSETNICNNKGNNELTFTLHLHTGLSKLDYVLSCMKISANKTDTSDEFEDVPECAEYTLIIKEYERKRKKPS